MRTLEIIADSGLLVAATAVALLGASAHAIGSRPQPSTAFLVFAGSLGVYLGDRLRDAGRDRSVHPTRSRIFLEHRKWTMGIACLLVVAAAVASLFQPRAVQLLLVAVFGLSLAHAGLKRVPWFKPLYIGLSWWAVTMGIPLLHHWSSGEPWPRLWTILPIGLAIAANVLACDAADRDAEALRVSPRQLWWIARGVAIAGVISGLVAGRFSAHLTLVPAAILFSLIPERPTVQWTTTAVDGALLMGAVAVLMLA